MFAVVVPGLVGTPIVWQILPLTLVSLVLCWLASKLPRRILAAATLALLVAGVTVVQHPQIIIDGLECCELSFLLLWLCLPVSWC